MSDSRGQDRQRNRARTLRPWERRSGESNEAYAAFILYRDMGPSRSIESLHRKNTETTPKSRTLKGWSARYEWVKRCGEWDAHIQRRKDRVVAEEAARWERRRYRSINKAWKLADGIEGRVLAMISHPLTTQVRSKDGNTIVVHPARWTYQSVAILAKALCEIRSACLAAAIRPIGDYTKDELIAMQDAREKLSLEAMAEDPESGPPNEDDDED